MIDDAASSLGRLAEPGDPPYMSEAAEQERYRRRLQEEHDREQEETLADFEPEYGT